MQRDDIYRQHGWQFARGTGIDSSVPAAWLPAITDLCTKVAALIPEEQREAFQWKDIKEKHGILAVVYHAPAALDDAVASLVEAAESACKTHATIQLIKVTEYRWHEHAIPIWQPVDSCSGQAFPDSKLGCRSRTAGGNPSFHWCGLDSL